VRHNQLRSTALTLLLITLASTHASSLHARPRTTRRTHRLSRVRHVLWNPVLRGSRESLLRQNAEIDRLQLPRISDDEELQELEQREELVPIEESDALRVAPNLPSSRRYCRPWTRDFLADFSEAYYQQFRQPVQVNSAVRTVEQQRKLRHRNGNAAPESGETASSHLAGVTVDIAKKGMNRKQHKWVQNYFLKLKNRGLIEPEEERRQAVFHVMVSDRYTDGRESSKLANQEPEK